MNILTFDIEDWFHTHKNRQQFSGYTWKNLPAKVEPNTDKILEMLDELELKATFFVLGWVAKNHPKLIKKIQSRGHEIGSHSYWHHNPHLITESDFEKDLKLSISAIQDVTGKKVTAYRAPGFNLFIKDQWAFDILFENGITVDSSIEVLPSQWKAPFYIEAGKTKILEFPLLFSQYKFPFTGGGYFRTIPLPILKSLFKEQEYHLFYLHPRDFDKDTPTSNMFSFFRNQLNTYNTAICLNKLKSILTDYKTISINQAVNILNSSKSND
jgi:polysaccharide deacetylase family protein (PEP-CTERM system associated)